MAKLCLYVLLALLLVQSIVSVDPPANSPGPAAELGDYSPPPMFPPSEAGSPTDAPVNSPLTSPPAPSDLYMTPGSSPAPSMSPDSTPVPAPAPTGASDINHSDVTGNGDEIEESSDGGMGGRTKAGIVAAVIAAACVVGFGGMVYKKRQDNIRRSQYGYAARRELL